MGIFKFFRKIQQKWFTLKNEKGFTLIEVLVAIGLLGTMVLLVANMTIANQNEILRHNAETYADLVASDQLSSLVALRNQYSFDNNPSGIITNWGNIYDHSDGSSQWCVYFNQTAKSFDLKTPITDPTIIGCGVTSKKLTNDGEVILRYFMTFSKMTDASGVLNPNLVKVHLQIKYNDRLNSVRSKDYYTVIGNYLGSQS